MLQRVLLKKEDEITGCCGEGLSAAVIARHDVTCQCHIVRACILEHNRHNDVTHVLDRVISLCIQTLHPYKHCIIKTIKVQL